MWPDVGAAAPLAWREPAGTRRRAAPARPLNACVLRDADLSELMAAPRNQTPALSDDSAEEPKKTQLSGVQVAASALAAVSSAVVASFFGVAGTLIGAALASAITTVSAALYTESLRKTNERLRRVREQLGRRPSPAAQDDRETRVLPAQLDPRRAPAPRRGPGWARVGAYAAAVFLVAMGIVTGVELIGQQPVSALVGHSQQAGTTTLGTLANAAAHQDTTPSTPSSPSEAPASPTENTAPSSEATPTQSEPSEETTSRATSSATESASTSSDAGTSEDGNSAPTTSPGQAATGTP